MGYLICQDCGGYYKLEKGESKEDFVSCQCYGSLIYVESLDEYLNKTNELNKDYEPINQVQLDNFSSYSDSLSESGFGGGNPQKSEIPQPKKEISESLSFSSFRGYGENSSVKNRNYYREISSKEIKPDIAKLKRVKDVNGIINSLNYDDPVVKLDAVQALGAIGDERALKHLDKIKNEEKGILKTYSQNAIFHIESKNKGLKSQNRAYYREEYYKKTTGLASEIKDITTTKASYKINNLSKKDSPKNDVSNVVTSKRDASNVVTSKRDVFKNDTSKRDVSKDYDAKKEIVYTKSNSKMGQINPINETEDVNGDDIYFIKFLGIKNTDKPLIGFIIFFVVFLIIGVILTMGSN
ncbi:MAG: HEAT repeat domain-containing protein [Methanobacterium formicicum]